MALAGLVVFFEVRSLLAKVLKRSCLGPGTLIQAKVIKKFESINNRVPT